MSEEEQQKLVQKLIELTLETFEQNIPFKIMSDGQKAPQIMYNAIMNLLCILADKIGLDKNKVKAHIDFYYNEKKEIKSN